MNFGPATRGLWYGLLAVGPGLVAAAMVLVLALAPIKAAAAIVLAMVFVIGAFLSGNPRLFCLWGLMIAIPFDLSKRFGPVIQKLGGETAFRAELSDAFVLALLAFLVVDLWTGRRLGLRVPKISYVWILIMLLGCVAIARGPWRMTAAHEVVRMLKVLVLFIVVCNELLSRRRFLHCVAGLTVGLILQAVVGLLQYATRAPLGLKVLGETDVGTTELLVSTSVRTADVYRVGAFMIHPNILGIFLAIVLPLIAGVALIRLKPGQRWLFIGGAVLGLGALIVTFSRSSWASFTAALLLLLLLVVLHHSLRRRSIVWMTAAAAAVFVVCLVFSGPISRRLLQSTPWAMEGRAEFEQDAVRMISARPILGWGLNGYVFAVPQFTKYGARRAHEVYGEWMPAVHNAYLLWLAETGVVGLALYLLVLGGVAWVAVGNLRVKDELLFVLNAACLGSVLALLVDGFFSPSLRANAVLRAFWVLAAIVMATRYWRLGAAQAERDAATAIAGQAGASLE